MSKPAIENLSEDLRKARLIGAATQIQAANFAKGDATKQASLLTRLDKLTKSAAAGRQKLYDQYVALGKEMAPKTV